MRFTVGVVVPNGVGDVAGYVDLKLAPYYFSDTRPNENGKWEYQYDPQGFIRQGLSRRKPGSIEDNTVAVWELTEAPFFALITRDGAWHDASDFGVHHLASEEKNAKGRLA